MLKDNPPPPPSFHWLTGPNSPDDSNDPIGRMKRETADLRIRIAHFLRSLGDDLLLREAERIEGCGALSPTQYGYAVNRQLCHSVFCCLCERRADRRFSLRTLRLAREWARDGLSIAHCVFTIPHVPSDTFSQLADCLLEAFTRTRARAAFRSVIAAYRYAVHCAYTDGGPHPHIHLMAAVRKGGMGVGDRPADIASELSRRLTGEFTQLLAYMTERHLGDPREVGNVFVGVIPPCNLHVDLPKLATYAARVDKVRKGGKSFLSLSREEVLDLFMWLRGCSKRHRRLRGGSIRRQRER